MKSKEFLRTDRSMSKACFVPGPRAEVSLRMFQPVQKAEKIIAIVGQHQISELNPSFAQLSS